LIVTSNSANTTSQYRQNLQFETGGIEDIITGCHLPGRRNYLH